MKLRTIFIFILSLLLLGCSDDTSTQSSSTNTLKVACVGDSITEGLGLQDPATQSYPAQLSSLLNQEGSTAENFGHSGATVLENGNRPYIQTQEFTSSLNFNPNVVIIMLGTNDTKDINWQYKTSLVSDYIALINQYKTLSSHPKIYIALPTPVFGNIQGITNERIENELIPLIWEVASYTQVDVIDLHSILVNRADLFPDKIHPNEEGSKIIAMTVYNVIR